MSSRGIASLARLDVVSALTAAVPGVAVHQVMPPTLYPPALLLTEADPFIQPSDTIGGYEADFEVVALVAPSSDEQVMLSALDEIVSALIEALNVDYRPQVAGYQTFTFANQQPHFGARLTLASTGWTIRKDTNQ